MNIDKQTTNVPHTYGYVVAPKLDTKVFTEDIIVFISTMAICVLHIR